MGEDSATRTVIITGAGSGLGRAMALALVARGHQVVVAGRRTEPLLETVRLARAAIADARIVAFSADITSAESVHQLVEATVDRFGHLDVLVNNAGASSWPGSVDELSDQDWREALAVNLTGSFLCARAAFAQLKRQSPQGGRIVNNGSISAHVPRPRSAAYTVTKHAITGLTKSIELDGRPFQIRCTQLDIGNAATPMTARMADGVTQADGSIRAEPTMDPAHVGGLVAYVVELPLSVTLPFATIAAADMPFIGRG